MSLKDEFSHIRNTAEELLARQRKWTPGVEWLGDDGTVTTDALQGDPEWDHILEAWNLDPKDFQIVEPVLFNSWGGEDGLTNRQFKAKVIRRTYSAVDLEPLIRNALKHKASGRVFTGDEVMTVVLADWQIGKADGDGVEGTIRRIVECKDAVINRAKALRRMGYGVPRLNVVWTGDSIEGCTGFYSTQTYAVELNRREQVTVTRRLLTESLQAWSKHFDEIVVAAVAGNHGEHRANGKTFTSLDDNDDIAVVEQVSEVLAANPDAFGHVRFVIASDALTLTIPVGDFILGITHGHVARSGAGVEGKLRSWWEKQAAGRQPIGDADILLSGHYHHLRVADWGGCVWLQSPALDGGSEWWRLSRGEVSQAGMLSFVTTRQDRVTELVVL